MSESMILILLSRRLNFLTYESRVFGRFAQVKYCSPSLGGFGRYFLGEDVTYYMKARKLPLADAAGAAYFSACA